MQLAAAEWNGGTHLVPPFRTSDSMCTYYSLLNQYSRKKIMSSTDTPLGETNQNELKRSLSHGQMTMIALGLALGTGLFLGSGAAIGIAGPAVLISYAFGSLVAAIIAACAGEMAIRYPVPGGFGTIATRYLSPYAGYLSRWAYWITTVPLTGAEIIATSHYMGYWYPQVDLWVWALMFGTMIVMLNIISVRSFGSTETVLSAIKVGAVLCFIVVGAIFVIFGMPGQQAHGLEYLSSDGGFMPNGLSSLWLSLAVVMFSFGGVELISISAAEAKDPARSVSSSVKAMIWRLSSFYVLSMLIILCLMPWRSAAEAGKDLTASPFVMVFSQAGIPAAAGIINFVVLIAAFSGGNAALYAATRQLHALAQDSMAPRVLAKTSKTGVPVGALAVSTLGAVIALLMALLGLDNIFRLFMGLVTFAMLLVWAMILITYLRVKKAHPRGVGFQVFGGRITAWIGLVGIAATFSALFVVDETTLTSVSVGLAVVLIISLAYRVLASRRGGFEPADLEALSGRKGTGRED